MRRKYGDCKRADGDCTACSLVNYGRDCHNRPITKLEWARRSAGLTQQQLADGAGVCVSQIRKIESGEIQAENLAAKSIFALAKALDVSPESLV